jgi:hypothetical protein
MRGELCIRSRRRFGEACMATMKCRVARTGRQDVSCRDLDLVAVPLASDLQRGLYTGMGATGPISALVTA